jgi:putative two-component system response regulator
MVKDDVLAETTETTLEVIEDALPVDESGEILDELLGEDGDTEPETAREAPKPGTIPHSVPALVPFRSSVFPALAVNTDLEIIAANDACRNLFTGFFSLEGKAFFEVFGKSFTMDDLRNIRETVRNGKNGFSWKGMARIKSRSAVTVETRVYIFPAELTGKIPEQFIIMFDDVTEENRRLLRSVFMSLLEASKLKDNDTGQHIIRVNHYARRMAEELFDRSIYENIDADFIDNIGFLASMHDVGKIGTPDDILNKEGPLSDWEWTVMQEHTKNGAFILSTYPNPMAKEIALSHHEKWNGSGYPFELLGDMIPLSARIVSISDVYDALRMERSYKPAFPHDVTVEKMMEGRGTQFDPTLLDVFASIAGDFDRLYEASKD